MGIAGEQVVVESVDLVKSMKESEDCEKRGEPVMNLQGNQHKEQPEEEDSEKETEKQPGSGQTSEEREGEGEGGREREGM